METVKSLKISMERDLSAVPTLDQDILLNFGFNEEEFSELCTAYRFKEANVDDAREYFNGSGM